MQLSYNSYYIYHIYIHIFQEQLCLSSNTPGTIYISLCILYNIYGGSPRGSDDKESACNAGDPGLIPKSRRSPGEENGYHSSILDWRIPMDRGAWWNTVS